MGVSWNDAVAYCKWLSKKTGKQYRLPTEAEWEYASRGGQNYKYAGSNDLVRVGWYSNNSGFKTQPVGQKQKNGYGLYDMSGNVCEWCSDWYRGSYYGELLLQGSIRHPKGPLNGSSRVSRGGGWGEGVNRCRLVYRFKYFPEVGRNNVGFRLAHSQ